MAMNHIDQLREWWDNAEEGAAGAGDTVIARYDNEDEYRIWTAEWDMIKWPGEVRILSRAPKPKPAWHDAVAVIAHTDDGDVRQVWERDGDTGYWLGTENCIAGTGALRDVTPLIEARVTDEMIERFRSEVRQWETVTPSRKYATFLLRAALGLDPDKENA